MIRTPKVLQKLCNSDQLSQLNVTQRRTCNLVSTHTRSLETSPASNGFQVSCPQSLPKKAALTGTAEENETQVKPAGGDALLPAALVL